MRNLNFQSLFPLTKRSVEIMIISTFSNSKSLFVAHGGAQLFAYIVSSVYEASHLVNSQAVADQ